MLVLSRKKEEEVILKWKADGKEVVGKLRITDICGDKVKIGFNFPLDVQIMRDDAVNVKQKNRTPKEQ